ncbi:hypothetical protein OSB04_009338 [Centaurea solstitialis]|uniref:Reverse transcriptase domain-containing protein n=1 Tax=Centaurea solstitialis TaxID=347529 RepID=A0AA38T750_9ASTR|nr:hypothetical protein OSB04_009338 [Centaurea solstitialis]
MARTPTNEEIQLKISQTALQFTSSHQNYGSQMKIPQHDPSELHHDQYILKCIILEIRREKTSIIAKSLSQIDPLGGNKEEGERLENANQESKRKKVDFMRLISIHEVDFKQIKRRSERKKVDFMRLISHSRKKEQIDRTEGMTHVFGLSEKDISICIQPSPNTVIWLTESAVQAIQPVKTLPKPLRVRQGDPLTPFLFILAAENLNVMMREAHLKDIFKGVQLGESGEELSLFQFADDSIVVGEWGVENAKNLIRILKCFEICSGLKINLIKSRLSVVVVKSEEITNLARQLKCRAEENIKYETGCKNHQNLKTL